MFSKISPVAKYPIASVYLYKHYVLYQKYVLNKNMLIFREFFNTQSDQNIYFKTHQTAPHFQNFLSGASIPKRINHNFFKKILHENNYPIAIVYLKYLFFYIKNCNF